MRLPPTLVEDSTDLIIYREVGEGILAGNVPYRDFFIEYPPGSLVAFVSPAFFATTGGEFAVFFALEMAFVLVATLVLTAYAAHHVWGQWWPLSAIVFTAAALMLYPVAVTRYDAVVAFTLAAACVGAMLGQTRAMALAVAWASLGFGAAAKLVPALATLPLALLGDRGEGTQALRETARGATWGFAIFLSVAGMFFLPALLAGGEGFVESFTYQADRGLQLESLAASILMALGLTEGTSFEYGAMEVQGRGVEFLSSMSLPVTSLLLAVTAVMMYREHRKGRFGPKQFPRFAAAFVLAFLLGSKVLSPQYMIWLLPLVPLCAGGAWGIGVSGVFLAICWATTQIYLLHYDELIDGLPSATAILLGRNLLLVILWALMLSIPVAAKPAVKPVERLTVEYRGESS